MEKIEDEDTNNANSANNTLPHDEHDEQDDDETVMRVKNQTTPNMLLLEDGTFDELPTHIHRALESLRKNRPSKMHILKVLVYIVSLESGFHTIDDSEPFNIASGCFNIDNIKKNIGYVSDISQDDTVLIKLSLTESSTDNNYMLMTRDIGDALCITFSHQGQPGKSIYLSASRYVLNAKLMEPAKCLNNLKELSMKLKDFLFTPIRNRHFESNNELFPSLNGLPPEVVWMIFNKLNVISLRNLSKTCLRMNSETKNYRQSRGYV
ncbi:hypothetical protein HA402_015327 [Bradysia odoriphaga]|nr:hypothetical protein HA402_015327 [Bradysia odoriphaga]